MKDNNTTFMIRAGGSQLERHLREPVKDASRTEPDLRVTTPPSLFGLFVLPMRRWGRSLVWCDQRRGELRLCFDSAVPVERQPIREGFVGLLVRFAEKYQKSSCLVIGMHVPLLGAGCVSRTERNRADGARGL